MTKSEAIEAADSKPRNENLRYYVCKWNNGYIIHCSSYMKRNPHIKYIYKTK